MITAALSVHTDAPPPPGSSEKDDPGADFEAVLAASTAPQAPFVPPDLGWFHNIYKGLQPSSGTPLAGEGVATVAAPGSPAAWPGGLGALVPGSADLSAQEPGDNPFSAFGLPAASLAAGEPSGPPELPVDAATLAGGTPTEMLTAEMLTAEMLTAEMLTAAPPGLPAGFEATVLLSAPPALPAPPVASAPAVLPPLDSPQWSGAFAEQVRWVAGGPTQTAELRLDPPQLGPVEVRVQLDAGGASLAFASPHAAVRDAIQASLPQLRDAFAQAGVQLGQVSVDSGMPSHQHGGGRQRSPFEAAHADRHEVVADVRWRDGLIDVFI